MMWNIRSHFGLLILLLVVCLHNSNEAPEFLGGMMTFTLEDRPDRNVSAHVEVLAGWRLGTGPCGPYCSARDVHSQTHRQLAASSAANSSAFGAFTVHYKEISTDDRQTFNESVVSVNEQLGWEQELMRFTITLNASSASEKVTYNGINWMNLTMQGSGIPWRFYTTIYPAIRNDTGKRNRSPKSFIKPIYRIPFNRKTFINLPFEDDDGDIVQCDQVSYLDVGLLSKHHAPGIIVHQNCSVEVAALPLHNYTGHDWIGVAVSVKDSNSKDIALGSIVYTSSRAIFSKLQVQFTVHVDTNLSTPVFVPPTPEPSHTFVIYVGAMWSTDVFAESQPRPVQQFIATGTMNEQLRTSPVQRDTKGRQNTVHAQISLAAPITDTLPHLVCVSAVDDTSVETFESRCFRLNVKDVRFNFSMQSVYNKPYFFDVPSPNETVQCPLHDTCILPIYLKSTRQVVNIGITQSNIDYTEVFMNVSNMTFNAEHVYRADVVLRNYIAGKFNVCLQAQDIIGVPSDELCMQLKLHTPDPCASAPCFNGRCILNDDEDTFICECGDGVTGRYCDKLLNYCEPNPCLHGRCFRSGRSYVCYCSDDNGRNLNNYTGKNCSEKIDDCPRNRPCNNNGICEDGLNNYTCNCFRGFHGHDCEYDACAGQSNSAIDVSCLNDGCPQSFCQQTGACVNGRCYCGVGFTGYHCENAFEEMDTHSTLLQVSLIAPTLTNGSNIVCSERNGVIQSCTFDMYITTSTGVQNVNLTTRSSAELAPNLSCTNWTVAPIFPGQKRMFVSRCSINGSVVKRSGLYTCVNLSTRQHVKHGMCLEITFEEDQNAQPGDEVFVPPTPYENSRLILTANEQRTILVYTRSINGQCEKVKSLPEHVHVLDPVLISGSTSTCMTELVAIFNQTGVFKIYLLSSQEKRSFYCVVLGGNNPDPCALVTSNDLCQNGGVCFPIDPKTSKCICDTNFTGTACERGPCHNAGVCMNGGQCYLNNHTVTCVCRPGFYGDFCAESVDGNISQHALGPVIDRTSGLVKSVDCNTGRLCEINVFVANCRSNQSSPVDLGFTSKGIDVKSFTKSQTSPERCNLNIQFYGKKSGQYLICVQTFAADRTNRDEACITINVAEGSGLIYGFPDRPKYISPSLQPQSVVECTPGGQCHVFYTATPGDGNDLKCLTATVSTDQQPLPFEHIVYSSCDACREGITTNKNCTFDIMFVPTNNIMGRPICVTLGLRGIHLEGETRCFYVTSPKVRDRCRTLTCHNGGFCDGHDEQHPVCYCRNGYAGETCQIAVNGCHRQFFETTDLIATEVQCSTGNTCSYSLKVCDRTRPIVQIAYSSNNLYSHIFTKNFTNAMGCVCNIETVEVTSSVPGIYRFCLQTKSRVGLVEDEICPTVRVSYMSNEVSVDKNKPYFVLPTLPSLSTVKCKRNGTCHLIVYHTEGYGSSQTCPRVKDTSIQSFEQQHIFSSEMIDGVCITDVAFLVPAYQGLNEYVAFCLKLFTTGKQGEERCFSMQFVDNVLSQIEGPCKGIACYGNSVCIANLTNNKAGCICLDGYTGTDCNLEVDECQSNPCTNGGTCKDLLNKYTCQCATGYFGHQCQLDINCDFDNNLFCGWRNAHTGDNFDWTLYHGPTPSEGTGPSVDHTVGNSNGTYAFIETSAPRQANQSAWLQSPLITTDDGMYCLSFWYHMFGPTIGQLNVYVSQNMFTPLWTRIWSESGDHGSSWLNAKLYINSSDPFMITFEGKVGDGYEGDIALDDISLSVGPCDSMTTMPYQTTTVLHLIVPNATPTTSTHGMHGTGCYGNPCSRGVCYVHLDDYFCLCPSGYEGRNCSIDVDECRSQPCKNGGTCEDDVDNFICHCVHGYTGKLCDTEIDECLSQPCQHGGQCVDGLNHYTCMCLDGFDGEHCQNVLDPCYDSPCMRGTCFSHSSLFLCVCPPGYSGKFCEKERI